MPCCVCTDNLNVAKHTKWDKCTVFSLLVPGQKNDRHKTKFKGSHRRVLAIEYKHCTNRILGLSASIICTNSKILNLIHWTELAFPMDPLL